MGILKVIPKHWFSWDFRIEDAVGMPWGEVGLSTWRERGLVVVGGQQYEVSRQGLTGPFVLEGPGGELARAVKGSAFKHEFTLKVEGREYTLSRLSWWPREYGLFADTTRVGSVTPESWFCRRAEASLPDDVPGFAQAFVVWLTLLMWKRAARAGAVAAGS
jgi:hypothetical protein